MMAVGPPTSRRVGPEGMGRIVATRSRPRSRAAPRGRQQRASLPPVSSPTTAAGPVVERGPVVFRLPDPDEELAGVRLATDRGFPVVAEPFAREGDGWTLRMPAPALDRFEYALAVQRSDGGH